MGVAATWFPNCWRTDAERKLSDRSSWWASDIAATVLLVGISVGMVALQPTAAGAGSATSNWSAVPGPSPSANFALNGMSCASSTSCTAVGYSSVGGISGLIESWNGTTWSVYPALSVPGAEGDQLNGVSCLSATACVAVGFADISVPNDQTQETLIETWDGNTWSVVPSPSPGYSDDLSSVSCTSTTDCVAAGSYSPESGQHSQTLIESWNGTEWSVISTPNPSPIPGNIELLSVSCSALDSCVAVGTGYTTSNAEALIETWDGTSWSLSPGAVEDAVLQGVSCTGPNSCVAVGRSTTTNQTVIESWNGTGWTLDPSPTLGRRAPFLSELTSVSCSDSSNCVAVGWFKTKSKSAAETLVETWDGMTWTFTPSPNPGATFDAFSGVSCVPPSAYCAGIGNFIGNSDVFETLFETNVPLTITTTSLPAGTEGHAYSATLDAISGNAAHSWKLVVGSGRLPKGLTLNRSTGVIAGTPQAAGTFPVNVEALDTKTTYPPRIQQTAFQTLSIVVSPA
jgi:hypothetical protein